MDEEGNSDQLLDESTLQPLIIREDLKKFWIGLGVAIDWIAMRGQPMSARLYSERVDKALEALVEALADMRPEIAKALVQGVEKGKPGLSVPVDSGIWGQTATSDANDAGQSYRLCWTDYNREWDGMILAVCDSSRRVSDYPVLGYSRVQIQADFILKNWPEFKTDIEPSPIRRVFAPAEVEHWIEKIVAMTPVDLAPLTQREIVELVKRCIPAAPRDVIRDYYRNHRPNLGPGPRSRRDPNRKLKIQKLGEKLGDELIAARLLN
jgi:hypothetical protein